MNQKITEESMRIAPLALALVLLVILGLLAIRVHAQEDAATTSNVSQQRNAALDDRKELFEEQARERGAQFERTRDAMESLREKCLTADGEISPDPECLASENVEMLRDATMEESRAMLQEHRTEQIELYKRQRAQLHTNFQEKKEQLTQKLEESREERREKAEQYKERFTAQVQSRLEGYVERMVDRMTRILERLEQIAQRVESRIDKSEASDIDVSDARTYLEEVYQSIHDAREHIALLGAISVEVITAEDPQENKTAIREAATLAKESIKTIHETLTTTLVELKTSATEVKDEETEESSAD